MIGTSLPLPVSGDEVRWVGEHLGHLCCDEPRRSSRYVGTQAAADAALASFDLNGSASRRSQVLPRSQRGASGLSPWIRHGQLTLSRVWAALDGPAPDLRKFRDELRWQEYSRHLYARLGAATSEPVRRSPAVTATLRSTLTHDSGVIPTSSTQRGPSVPSSARKR